MYLSLPCSDGWSRRGKTAKLLKVSSMAFPLGVVVTLVGSPLLSYTQELSYYCQYAQAIWINGKLKLSCTNVTKLYIVLCAHTCKLFINLM